MSAYMVVTRDPFQLVRREFVPIEPGRPVRDVVPVIDGPFIVWRNGAPLLRRDWDCLVGNDDLLLVQALAGDGDSNPLALVAGLVAMIFAPQMSAYLVDSAIMAGASAGFVTGIAAVAPGIITAVGGMILSSALVAAPKPASSLPNTSVSPTYSLGAQGNVARLGGVIPVQYGDMIYYPDFGAQPYIEYAGNEQYLYQLFCLGAGMHSVSDILIEDTPITSFADVSTEVVMPGYPVTLFPTAVVTAAEVSGQDMPYNEIVGPYTANAAGTTANSLAFDIVLPRGLYQIHEGNGDMLPMSLSFVLQALQIDDAGVPVGSWTTLQSVSLTKTTTTPLRLSYKYAVAAGRYQCRVLRTSVKATSGLVGNDLAWGGLRAYLVDDATFGDVTMLAMRVKASNSLSSLASRRVRVRSVRMLPTWDGSTWLPESETSSIAWAFADACKNIHYGARLPDSRLDVATLASLDATWAARGDEFNGRFDGAMGFWEALTKIANAGRAKPYLQGGIVRIARDQPATLPVALFSMRNIRRGSFSVSYIMPGEDTADEVNVTYWDNAKVATDSVPANLPDSASANPVALDMSLGVTSRDQAHREGMYYAACNRYRRKKIRFATEMDGFIPSFGDLIAVAHDMPAWGQTAEVVGWDDATLSMIVSEPLTWESGQLHYIGLRAASGSLEGPISVTAGTDAYRLSLGSLPATSIVTGLDSERTHVVFGWGETWRQLARVLSVTPRGTDHVEIECINEADAVHTADSGVVTPPPIYGQLTTTYTRPLVAGLTMRSSPDDVGLALLSWTPAPGADYYIIEMALDPDDEWTRVGETTASNFAVRAIYGASTWIRVAGVGMTVGPFVTLLFGSVADYMWADDSALMWNADDSTLMWSY